MGTSSDRRQSEGGLDSDKPGSDAAPLVSIGLPVFNGLPEVEAAVQSLLEQDYPNLEIIIADNASTDGTWDYLARFASDPRITLIRNETNVGAAGNFKVVLHHAKGKYFKWAAHDDLWSLKCISTLVRELEQHPEATIAMGATETFRNDGRSWQPRGRFPEVNYWSSLRAAWSVWSPVKYNYFVYGLMRTATLLRAVPILEGIVGSDRMLVAQMALFGPLRYVDEVVYSRYFQPRRYKTPRQSWFDSIWTEMRLYGYMLRTAWCSHVLPTYRKPLVLVMLVSRFYHKALVDGLVEPAKRAYHEAIVRKKWRKMIRRSLRAILGNRD